MTSVSPPVADTPEQKEESLCEPTEHSNLYVSKVLTTDVQSWTNDTVRSEQISDPIKEHASEVFQLLADTSKDSELLRKTFKGNSPNAEQNKAPKEDASTEQMEYDEGSTSDASDYDRLVIDTPSLKPEGDDLSRLESALLVAAAAAEQHHAGDGDRGSRAESQDCTHSGDPRAQSVDTRSQPVPECAETGETRTDGFEMHAAITHADTLQRAVVVKSIAETVKPQNVKISAHVVTLPTIVCPDSNQSNSKSLNYYPPKKKKVGRKKKVRVENPKLNMPPAGGAASQVNKDMARALQNLSRYKDLDWLEMFRQHLGSDQLPQARLALAEALRYFPAVYSPRKRSLYSKLSRRQGYATLARALGMQHGRRLHWIIKYFKQHYYSAGVRTSMGALVAAAGRGAGRGAGRHWPVFSARLAAWLDAHYPADWRCWELANLTYRQLFPEPPNLSNLRFALPPQELARVLLHSPGAAAAAPPYLTYDDARRAARVMVSRALGRALLLCPVAAATRLHGAAGPWHDAARRAAPPAAPLSPAHYSRYINSAAFHEAVPPVLPDLSCFTNDNPEVMPLSLRESGHEWIRVMDEYMPEAPSTGHTSTQSNTSCETIQRRLQQPSSESVNEFLLALATAARGGLRPPALSELAARYRCPPAELERVWHTWRACVLELAESTWARGDDVALNEVRAADWLALDVQLLDGALGPLLHQGLLVSREAVAALWLVARLCLAYDVERAPDAFHAVQHVYLSQGRVASVVVLQRRWWELKRLAAAAAARPDLTHHQPLLSAILQRYPHAREPPRAWSLLVAEGRLVSNDVMYSIEEPWLRSRMPDKYKHIDASLENPFADDKDDDVIIVEDQIETIELDGCDVDKDTCSRTCNVQSEKDDATEQDLLLQDVGDSGDIQTKVIFDSDSDSDDNDRPRVLQETNTELDKEIKYLSNTITSEILRSKPTNIGTVEPISENIVCQESNMREKDNLLMISKKELKDERLDINVSVDDSNIGASVRSVSGNSEVSEVGDSDETSRYSATAAPCARSETNPPVVIDPKLVMLPVVNLTALHFIPAWSKYSRRRKISLTNLRVEDLYDDNYKNIIKKKKLENEQRTQQVKILAKKSTAKIVDQKLDSLAKRSNSNKQSHPDKHKAEILTISKQILKELDIESQNQAKDSISQEIMSVPVIVNPSEPPKYVHLNVSETRRYTATSLSKNPDFNTIMKKLTSRFWLSDRNRCLMNKCFPVTIDLVKQALQNNPIAKVTEPLKGRVLKKIQLPDIDDVRRINRNILTAAVNPINVRSLQKYNSNIEIPAAQPVEPVEAAPRPPASPPPPLAPAGPDSTPEPLPEELELLLQSLKEAEEQRADGACCSARRWLQMTAARRRSYLKAHARRPPPSAPFACARGDACVCCCEREARAAALPDPSTAPRARSQLQHDLCRLLAPTPAGSTNSPKPISSKRNEASASSAASNDEDSRESNSPPPPFELKQKNIYRTLKYHEKYKQKSKQKYLQRLKKKGVREQQRPDRQTETRTETAEPADDDGLQEWIREKNKARALFGVYPPKRKPPPPAPPAPPQPSTLPATLRDRVSQPPADPLTHKQQHRTLDTLRVGTFNIYERNIFDSSVSCRQVDTATQMSRDDDVVEVSDSETDTDVNLDCGESLGEEADAPTDTDGEETDANGVAAASKPRGLERNDADRPRQLEAGQKFINIVDHEARDHRVNVTIIPDPALVSTTANTTANLATTAYKNISDIAVVRGDDRTPSTTSHSNANDSNVSRKSTVNYVFLNKSGSKLPCEIVDANTALLRYGDKHFAINIDSIGSAEEAAWTIDLTDDTQPAATDKGSAWFQRQRRLLHAAPRPVRAAELLRTAAGHLADLRLIETDTRAAGWFAVRGAWAVVSARPPAPRAPRPPRPALWRPAPRAALLLAPDHETEGAKGPDTLSAPRRVQVHDAVYYKLSDHPLVYAQVWSVLADIGDVVAALRACTPLALYHLRLGALVPFRDHPANTAHPAGASLRLRRPAELLDAAAQRLEADGAQVSRAVRLLEQHLRVYTARAAPQPRIVMESSLVPIDASAIKGRLKTSGLGVKSTGVVGNSASGVVNASSKLINTGAVNPTSKVINTRAVNSTSKLISGAVKTTSKVDKGKKVVRASIQQTLNNILQESASDDDEDETPLSELRSGAQAAGPRRGRPKGGGTPGGSAPARLAIRRRILAGTLARAQRTVYTPKGVSAAAGSHVQVLKLNPGEMKELLSYTLLDNSFTFRPNKQDAAGGPAPEPSTSTVPSNAKIFNVKDIERWRKIIDYKIVALAKADASLGATKKNITQSCTRERDITNCTASTIGDNEETDRIEPNPIEIDTNFESKIVIENVVSMSDNSAVGNIGKTSNKDPTDILTEEQTQREYNTQLNERQDENDTKIDVVENDTKVDVVENDTHFSKKFTRDSQDASYGGEIKIEPTAETLNLD